MLQNHRAGDDALRQARKLAEAEIAAHPEKPLERRQVVIYMHRDTRALHVFPQDESPAGFDKQKAELMAVVDPRWPNVGVHPTIEIRQQGGSTFV
jgi:hypothetical protein